MNVLPRCRLSYAKIVQIEGRTSNLFECFAEMPPILCKDSANRRQYKPNLFGFIAEMPPILCKDSANRRQYKTCCMFYCRTCAFENANTKLRFYIIALLYTQKLPTMFFTKHCGQPSFISSDYNSSYYFTTCFIVFPPTFTIYMPGAREIFLPLAIPPETRAPDGV